MVKTNAPDKRLPTNVDITSPAVIEIIPALVKSAVGETPNVFRTPKIMTKTASASIANCSIVAAWIPIFGVMSGLMRRKSIIAVNQKPKMMIILMACINNMGRLIGTATNRSKT